MQFITDGYFCLASSGMGRMMGGGPLPAGADTVRLSFQEGFAALETVTGGKRETIRIAMNGAYVENHLDSMPGVALCSGVWEQENVFAITMRMVETCNQRFVTITFGDEDAVITDITNHPFVREPNVIKLKMV